MDTQGLNEFYDNTGVRKLAVLLSSEGAHLHAIIDAIAHGRLNAQVAVVAANKTDAEGLAVAREAGIPVVVAPAGETDAEREARDADLAAQIGQYAPDLIVLTAFTEILSRAFLSKFPGRVINLHASLPEEFPGLHPIHRAFEAWQRGELTMSGCVVRYVTPDLERGSLIAQREVPFQDGDTLDLYTRRMHVAEQELLIDSISRVLDG